MSSGLIYTKENEDINGIHQQLFPYIVPKGVLSQADDKGNVVSLWKYKCVLAANSLFVIFMGLKTP